MSFSFCPSRSKTVPTGRPKRVRAAGIWVLVFRIGVGIAPGAGVAGESMLVGPDALYGTAVDLTLTDLFVGGLGIEVVGAVLIARGLLARFSVVKSFGTVGGIGVAEVVDRTRNRVDAFFGVGYLAIGVVAQIVGYLAEADGEGAGPFGGRELLGGVLLLVVGAGGAFLVWVLSNRWAFRAMLVQVAFAPLFKEGEVVAESREKKLWWLSEYARAAQGGEKESEDEDSSVWLEQMFGADTAKLGPRRSWWWPWCGGAPS
jgi:hypothetical protein